MPCQNNHSLSLTHPHSLSHSLVLAPAQFTLPTQGGRTAEWRTTYCDDDVRVGRGSSGNVFLFRKQR